MKKSLILATLLAIGATSVAAMDTQWFVGIGAERVKTDVSTSIAGVTYSGDGSDTAAKIVAGAIINKNHRVSLSYAKFDDDGTIKTTLLNYDYLIATESKFTPYIGIHAGIVDASMSAPSAAGTLSVDDKGTAYGIQTGALYDVTNNIELEANIAYTTYSADSPIKLNGVAVPTTNYELDKTTSFYVGVNYKF